MASALILETGPLLIGTALSYFFFGVFFVQLYIYFTTFASSDRRLFIGLVILVAVIELLHLILMTHVAFALLAEGFGNPQTFSNSPWSGSALPTLNGIVSMLTQLFFAWRITHLGKNKIALACGIVIALLAFMQCAAAIAVTVQFVELKLRISLVESLGRTILVWLAGTLACDVLITASIISILVGYRLSTSFQSSKNLIDTFIAHTIENGLLTTICAIINIVFFLVYPKNLIYISVEFVLGRLYANVLLATLNRRDRSRMTARSTAHDIDIHSGESSYSHSGGSFPKRTVSLVRFKTSEASSKTIATATHGPAVSITRETETETEVETGDDFTSTIQKDDVV